MSLYEIKRLKLKDKHLEEREALMNEKLFTVKDVMAAQENKRFDWAAFILGALVGAFIIAIAFTVVFKL